MTLYELTDNFKNLLNLAEDPDVDPEVIADTMEAINGELEDKAEGYAMVMRQLTADADAIQTEIDRLTARKKAINANTDRMKAALFNSMKATGKVKFKTRLFSFGIRKNPASVVIDDPAAVPAEFLVPQEPKIDKKGIKSMLQNLGGPSEWAHLEQSESLSIK